MVIGYKRIVFVLCTTIVVILCMPSKHSILDLSWLIDDFYTDYNICDMSENIDTDMDYLKTLNEVNEMNALTLEDFEKMNLPIMKSPLVKLFLRNAKEHVAFYETLTYMLEENGN